MSKWERFYLGAVACLAILALAGCQAAKSVYDACRDGMCR
jgi:hypothetical protein